MTNSNNNKKVNIFYKIKGPLFCCLKMASWQDSAQPQLAKTAALATCHTNELKQSTTTKAMLFCA